MTIPPRNRKRYPPDDIDRDPLGQELDQVRFDAMLDEELEVGEATAPDWGEERRPEGVDRVVRRYRSAAIDDFDPDAAPDPFIPETPQEAVDRLARTPISAEGFQQAPTLTDARLDGHQGIGILRLMRDSAGMPIRAQGTWRSEDGSADLSGALAIGSSQRFVGVLHDASTERPVDVSVTVTGHGDYRDAQGNPLRLVRFVSPEAVERSDPAYIGVSAPRVGVRRGY